MMNLKPLSLVSLLIAGGGLSAQEAVGTVIGNVKDSSGNLVTGAVIQLTGAQALGGKTSTSDAQGRFRFPLILPGTYTVRVSKPGFLSNQANFVLSSGQTLTVELRIRPEEIKSEVVEVISTSAMVAKENDKVATNFNFGTLSALPTGGNMNAYGALRLSPGVSGNLDYARIRGGITGQAQYTVNGVSVRDNVVGQGRQFEFVLDDLTEDIQVIQNPMNAKHGNTSSGTVNVTTKTGTNQFSGSFRTKLGRDPWRAFTPVIPNRFNAALSGSTTGLGHGVPNDVRLDNLTKTHEITLSGPIIKDKLTFTYGTRLQLPNDSRTTLVNRLGTSTSTQWSTYIPGFTKNGDASLAGYTYGVNPAAPLDGIVVQGTNKFTYNTYKLFWQINQNHQVDVNYGRDTYRSFATGNVTDPLDANISFWQDAIREMRNVNYRGIIGNHVITATWGRRASKIHFPTGPNDPVYTRAWTSQATTIFSTNFSSIALESGSTSSPDWQVRDVETFSLNDEFYIGSHKLDFGAEVLNERALLPVSSGINNRLFYFPGRLWDGQYVVYNYEGSFAAGTSATAATMRLNAGYIPEYRTRRSSGGGDLTSLAASRSLYFNDYWTLNANWAVNLGIRFTKWKNSDRTGTRISSQAFQPRLRAQFDLNGDSKHVFQLGLSDMRGTMNQAMLGTGFLRAPGNETLRYFWNQGSATTPYAVPAAQAFNIANFGHYYRYENTDVTRQVDPNIRPERTRDIEFQYKRSFSNGGHVRASVIYRVTDELFDVQAIDQRMDMVDPLGTPATAPNGYLRYLTQDKNNKREYRSLEFEWRYPLVNGESWRLDWGGFWTMARSVGRLDFNENGGVYFYDKMQAMGIPIDLYNPSGNTGFAPLNNARTWLSFSHGGRKGVRNDLSLMVNYSSGGTETPTQAYFFPAGVWTSGAQDVPTTFNLHYNGRGMRTGQDFYGCDLQWNVTIPLKGTLSVFAEWTITNVFNNQIPSGFNVGYWNTNTRNWIGLGDVNNRIPTTTAMHNWGTKAGFNGVRNMNTRFDVGIRF